MSTDHYQLLEKYEKEYISDVILGRRLAKIREQAILTQEDLALLSGIPIDELMDYENGQIPISLNRMRAIASALDTDAVTLVIRMLFPIS